ncbi:MAG: NTP transferase domain-containing protein [Deltaproteobacteria bacterium]|nr:NTP transferase domain-containing protein [Deltaproteobacteria bacterium]
MGTNVAAVILAAGLGTRMKSDKAKVLHPLLGRPMISYVLETAAGVAEENVLVIVGHQAEAVMHICSAAIPGVRFAHQERQLGTGHAVLCAMPGIPESVEHVLILCGDVPLLRKKTVARLLEDHRSNARTISLLAVNVEQPRGYGRVVVDEKRNLSRIVEEADASETEKEITLINSGIYCVNREFLKLSLRQLTPDNAQGEFYLTDIIGIGYQRQEKMGVLVGEDNLEVSGVNSVDDLEFVENVLKEKTI